MNKLDSVLYPNKSAYQLQEVAGGVAESNFVITKYLQNPETKEFTPIKYNLLFGEILGENLAENESYYFKWEIDEDKNRKIIAGTSTDYNIHAKVKESDNIRYITPLSSTKDNHINHSFIGLKAELKLSPLGNINPYGGAIYNKNTTLGNITGDFIGNYASYSSSASGGAIYNYSASSSSHDSYSKGGAIYNYSSIISFKALDRSMQFTGNYVENNSVKTSNAIYNVSDSENGKAILNFNAFNGNKITVNDGIDGGTEFITNQVLEINKALLADYAEAKSYSVVEFNNEVKNQVVNVHNGTLKLGSYAGGEVVLRGIDKDDNGIDDTITVDASMASLNLSAINVSEGAQLRIGKNTAVNIDNTSYVIMNENSTLLFEANASLNIASTSDIILNNANVEVDLTGIMEDFSYNLIELSVGDERILAMYDYLDTNMQVSANGELLTKGTSLTSNFWDLAIQGNSIVISGNVIPEPSTYAMIAGILALGFAYYRRTQK